MKRLLSGIALSLMAILTISCSNSDSSEGMKVNTIIPDQTSINLEAFETHILKVKVVLAGGKVSTTEFYDFAANPANITWSFATEGIATLEDGTLTAKQAGSTVLTLKSADGVYVYININVSNNNLLEALSKPLSQNVIYSSGVTLNRNAVMQCFDIDSDGKIWYVQVAGTDGHTLNIQNGEPKSATDEMMEVRWFGHGTNMAIEESGDDTYIWLGSNGNKLSDGSYSQSQTISRFKFADGEVLDNYAGETFYLPGKYNTHPAIDVANDVLGVTCSTSAGRDFFFYSLKEAMALPEEQTTLDRETTAGGEDGTSQTTEKRSIKVRNLSRLTPIGTFTVKPTTNAAEVNHYSFQGFDCTNGVVYFYEGIGNKNDGAAVSHAFVTGFNMKGTEIIPRTRVEAINSIANLKSMGITTTGYMEAEGIKYINGTLYCGFATKSSDNIRRAAVFAY